MREPPNSNGAPHQGAVLKDQSTGEVSSHSLKRRPGQLVDRFGHLHSESVFANWSAGALKALDVHRYGEREGER
jgi:hypothetical protein